MNELEFINDNKNEFTGILNYLRMKAGSNIESEILIYANSCYNINSYPPINVILYENPQKCFISNDYANSMIFFDFKDNLIIPTAYTIRTIKDSDPNYIHLKSWVIEVSNDAQQWTIVDEQIDNCLLNGPGFVHTFSLNNLNKNKIRFLRIRQISKNWNNSNYLGIESFEIYGTLFEFQ